MRPFWHNRIARSSALLPVAAVVTTLLWWLPQGAYSLPYLIGWGVCAVAMFFIIEMTAQNALLRVRSRMVSSLFLLLMAVCGFLHELCDGSLLQLAMVVSLFALLRTAEKARPELDTFHAYLCLSLGCLVWPPLLWLSLVLLFVQAFLLRSLTLRSLGAVVIGLLLPYVFWVPVLFVMGDISPFLDHIRELVAPVMTLVEQVQKEVALAQTYTASAWASIENERLTAFWTSVLANHLKELAALILVGLICATGVLYYCSNSFDDKTRVRMCHYAIIAVQVSLALWLLLQPWLFSRLFPLLLFTSVPACAYWAVFSRSWLARFWFVLLFLGLVFVGFLSLTPPAYLSGTFLPV